MVYGLLTVLNIKDMGFFIPHRYAAGLERDKDKTCWVHKWFSEGKIDVFSDTLETVSVFNKDLKKIDNQPRSCLLYTSPSPRDQRGSRMPSSA